jgi:uncharacterized protein DUF222
MARSAIRDAIETAGGVDRSGWSAAARSAELVELLEAQERLGALIQRTTGEWNRDQCWAADDARSAVSWLLHRVPITSTDAAILVRTARHVARHDATAKALDAGDISAAHTTIIGRAVQHRESLYPEHEDTILDAARSLAPTQFRDAMQHWASCADDVLGRGGSRRDLDGNYLDLATTFGGVGHLEGRFDPLSFATLKKVLDEMEPPDPKDAPIRRSLSQRRADALMRLITGERAPEVNVDAIVDIDTIAGRMPTDLTRAHCEIDGVGTISPALMSLLLCDCAIGRVLLRGSSEVLDLGRRTRLITPSLRRALRVRDRTCVEPGCTLPASYCDGHHIIHWTHHGETNLPNLELRCRRHHLRQHQRDLQAARVNRRE